uniref:CSON012210 protein n=1 Tax=Culicoides sonorensis TaxID=179676 RepID=A0A336M4Y9_CULSO
MTKIKMGLNQSSNKLRKLFYLICVFDLITFYVSFGNFAVEAAIGYSATYTNNGNAANKYSKQTNQQEMELDYTEMRGDSSRIEVSSISKVNYQLNQLNLLEHK